MIDDPKIVLEANGFYRLVLVSSLLVIVHKGSDMRPRCTVCLTNHQINFIFWIIQINLGDLLATILIKNLPEDILKELKRLKVELGCKTWAELLYELVASNKAVLLNEEKTEQMRNGVKNFLKLRNAISHKWTAHPTVLEETRRARGHETN